jgi:hypothetical protein
VRLPDAAEPAVPQRLDQPVPAADQSARRRLPWSCHAANLLGQHHTDKNILLLSAPLKFTLLTG